MKTTVKKLISTLLVFVMLLSAAPLSGFVGIELPEIPWAELFTPKAKAATSGTCGDNLTWTLDDEGTLTISGTGKMKDYSSSSSNRSPWYNNTSIKNVIIQNGVTYIGDYAFCNCSSLTEITIPEGVTIIGDYAFCGCSSLTEITIPEGMGYIGEHAFEHCSSLTEITLPEGVMSIGYYAFRYCSSLTEITIPESVTSIVSSAFEGCNSLKKVNITDLEAWCKISFRSYNSNPLRNGAELYLNGEKVTKLTIPDTVTEIKNYSFSGCSSLTEITIPEGVTYIGGYAFLDCSSLTKITIPKGVTSIGENAFEGCSSLTEITLPESVTSIGSVAFGSCSSLTEITIPESVTSIGDYAFRYCSSLTEITIPEGVTTSIGKYMFRDCSSLTEITIPESVTSIGDYAFYGCSALTDVYYAGSEEQWNAITIGTNNEPLLNANIHFGGDIENDNIVASGTCGENLTWTLDDEGTLTISGTGDMTDYSSSSSNRSPWYNNTDIKKVIIQDGVTSIGKYAFYCCSSLTEITIPEGVTSIGWWAFDDCSSLKKVNITDIEAWCKISFEGSYSNPLSNGAELYINGEKVTKLTIPDTVTEIKAYAFNGCISLTEITLPEGVTSIGNSAFSGCSSLIEITIPESVTSIGADAFEYCSSLTKITLPESLTSIGDRAFYGCSSLTEITIPEGVTSIGNGAFRACSSLTEITIPESVTSIGSYAFDDCSSLKKVNITDLEAWCKISFGGSDSNPLCNGAELYLNGEKVTKLTIPDTVTEIKAYAFNGCISLTEITLPEGVTSIGDSAFEDCSSLTKITIPEGATSIGSFAFECCSSLTEITISEGVTSIGDYAFSFCNALTEITIPEGVTSIGDSAFNGCSSLTEITILNPTCEIYDEMYTIYSSTTIYGYTGSTAEDYAIKYNRKFVPLDGHTHSYTAKVTLPATCATTGVMTYTCECKDSYTEDIPVDLNNHTGETEVRGFVSFSCLTGGYTGDTYCLACNTKLADGEATPATGNHTYEYKTMTEVIEIKGNNKIDLVFVVDTTGSMGSYISAMKEGMKSYLSQLEAKNIDYRIAIVDYRDFASRADTTDYPYKVQLAFTSNENSVITAINRLVLGNGGDTKETVYSALIDGLNELTWRKDAGKTVILMGDADALDPEPNTGYTLMDVVESLQNDYSSPVTLFSICAKGSTISTFATLATQTGGKCYTSAASLDVSEFVSDIIEVIEKTVIIPDSEWVQTKEPTCIEPGEESRTCTVCGDVQTRTVRALGHDFVVTSEADATCTESGYVLYTCSRCDLEKTENIAPYGHDFGSDNICDRCGFGTPSEHKHSYTATIVSPTCTGMGYTEYSCDCGDIYRSDYIEQKGHSWNDGVVTKEKTCTEAGILLKTCTVCFATRNDIIPASHEWSEVVTKEATCTEDGAKICTCTVCGETSSEVIPAGHKWTVQTVTKEATCTEPGKETRTCSVCGISQDFDTPVLGHNFVDGICTRCGIGFIDIITKDYANPEYGMYFAIDDIVSDYGPSLVNEYGLMLDYNEGAKFDKVAIYLTQDGTMWRRCIACTGTDITNATYVPYLAYDAEILYTGLNSVGINTFRLSKNSSGIWEYSNYATIGVNLEDAYGNLLLSLYDIGQAGAKTRIFDDLDEMKAWLLEDCEAHTEEIIPGVEPTCEGVGYTSGIKCSDCGEILVEPEEIPPTGHNWDSGKITLEPTCTETGEKVYTCQNNSSHIYTDDVPVADHKWDDGTVSKNPTCTETGTMLYKCVYDNSHTKTEDIEILPHTETLIKGFAPTCTEEGLTDGVKCSVCGFVITEQEVIPLAEHTPETVKGYPATCTETGLTDGVKCSVCGFVITEQEVIPLAEHTPETVKGYSATCTAEGLTDGEKCSVCDFVILEQEVIPLAEHTPETVKGYPTTCTETGLTDGVKCSVCGFVITEQEVIPLAEHTPETVKGYPSTCTQEGLADEVKCSVCGFVIQEQTTLPLAEHTPKKVNEKAPEVGVPGYTGDIVCGVCGKVLEHGEEIAALNPADVCDHMCHKDGFLGFIWKIINFFQKLFGINPVCECGERHY